jgi:hypothetical protein
MPTAVDGRPGGGDAVAHLSWSDLIPIPLQPTPGTKMDAETLRLILIVVGALFILGVYLWERRRHAAQRPGGGERDP